MSDFAQLTRPLISFLWSIPVWVMVVSGLAYMLWSMGKALGPLVGPRAKRLFEISALTLIVSLLVALGLAVTGSEGPLLSTWQWVLGMVLMPILIRTKLLGGVGAAIFFLCLAHAILALASWIGDPAVVQRASWVLGMLSTLAAWLVSRIEPPPPPPPEPEPLPESELEEQFSYSRTQEGADKYTRE